MLKQKRLTCIFRPRLKRSRTWLSHADAVSGQHSELKFHPRVQIHHGCCPSVPVNHLRDWEQTEKPRLNRNDLAYTLKSTIKASSWANVYSKPRMSRLENGVSFLGGMLFQWLHITYAQASSRWSHSALALRAPYIYTDSKSKLLFKADETYYGNFSLSLKPCSAWLALANPVLLPVFTACQPTVKAVLAWMI